MWSRLTVVLNFVLVSFVVLAAEEGDNVDNADPIDSLVAQLRTNANLDLSRDEEYEDLRAELLAYHSALTKLNSGTSSRRSMVTTACWQLGGVCVNFRLCDGYRFLTQVPGCMNRLNVCCFTWNNYRTKDFRSQGIPGIHYPWPLQQEFGGKGVLTKETNKNKSKKKKKKKNQNHTNVETLAVILRTR